MGAESLLLILLSAAFAVILALIGTQLWIVLAVLSRLLPPEPGSSTLRFMQSEKAGAKLNQLGQDITQKAEQLKSAVASLSDQEKAESGTLLFRAEKLTSDLKTAVNHKRPVTEITPLIRQGSEVMEELEKQAKRLASSPPGEGNPE